MPPIASTRYYNTTAVANTLYRAHTLVHITLRAHATSLVGCFGRVFGVLCAPKRLTTSYIAQTKYWKPIYYSPTYRPPKQNK